MPVTAEQKYLTVQAAAEVLHTNRRRIWQLIRDHQLKAIENPLDRREKLILRAEVERLAIFSRPRHADGVGPAQSRPRPRTFDLLDDPDLQSEELEDCLLVHWHPEGSPSIPPA